MKNEQYKKELKQLKIKMEKAESFSEKLPVFAKQILENKITGEEYHIKFGEFYKGLFLNWGINRVFYDSKERKITNYKKIYIGNLFSIYVNSYSLFNKHVDFGLDKSLEGVSIFFKDEMNSTFYVKDENIEAFLDALSMWYSNARNGLAKYNADQREIELLEELAKIKKIQSETPSQEQEK